MIRACDGHRGHGEGGCGWRSSGLREADGDACPLCGGALVEAPPPAPRRPVAGWGQLPGLRWRLESGLLAAEIEHHGWPTANHVYEGHVGAINDLSEMRVICADIGEDTLEAAQLAAEDALLAVLTDAARALGKRVVS